MAELKETEGLQTNINECYEHLVNFILDEAGTSSETGKGLRASTKPKKYWDDELSRSWKSMKESEQIFKQDRNSISKKLKHSMFKSKQKLFDKLLKRKKRDYCKGRMMEINDCLKHDPKAFWKYVKNLGPSV